MALSTRAGQSPGMPAAAGVTFHPIVNYPVNWTI